MSKIPFIQFSATLAASALILSGVCGFSQPEQISEVAGINLKALQEVGFRIDWINKSGTNTFRLPTISGHSMYVIDKEDYVSRFELKSGKWLWSSPVGNQIYDVQSITEFSDTGFVYIVADGAIYVLETATGNYPTQSSSNNDHDALSRMHFPLEWVASTGAIRDGKYLVYGSNTGDTIWFDPTIGFNAHRYRIGTSVNVTPSLVRGVRDPSGLMRTAVIASAKDGSLIAIDTNQVTQLWKRQLLEAVESKAIASTHTSVFDSESVPRTSVFIAATDQYLRSIDLHTGRSRWKVLTTAPLVDPPFIFGEALYQRIPSMGLASYVAFPNTITGQLNWLVDDVTGSVITTTSHGSTSERLVCWDKDTHMLQVVDTHIGGVVSTLSLPNVKFLLTDSDHAGSLYIINNDDTILKLIPRG